VIIIVTDSNADENEIIDVTGAALYSYSRRASRGKVARRLSGNRKPTAEKQILAHFSD
jgi:hypothetical protein